jgi:octanoyl-[GcvH]:protein N-octanoyltransferase
MVSWLKEKGVRVMGQNAYKKVREIIDTSAGLLTGQALYPFAVDEILCKEVGSGHLPPVLHIWRHQNAFILGIRDRKLPHAERAIDWLESTGSRVGVRNSGGAAVPLDPGVVNLSLILPSPRGKVEIKQDFEIMYQLMRECLKPLVPPIEKGEIQGSFCPGDYDLSIDGRKFCGIAQRRQIRAFVIQAFVLVEGKGRERGKKAKQFYDLASGGDLNLDFPKVEPGKMAALSEWNKDLTVDRFVSRVKEVAGDGQKKERHDYEPAYEEPVREMLTKIQKRYGE